MPVPVPIVARSPALATAPGSLFANPAKISDFALGLSQSDYMTTWSGYTSDPRFVHDPGRLAKVRGEAARLAEARDKMRPGASEDDAGR